MPSSPVNEPCHFRREPPHEKANKNLRMGEKEIVLLFILCPRWVASTTSSICLRKLFLFFSSWGVSKGSSTVAPFAVSKKWVKKRHWLLNGGWVRKRTCRRVSTTAIPFQKPERAKQLQAKPSNEAGFDEAWWRFILFFNYFHFISFISFQNLSAGLWSWNWREPSGVFLTSNSCFCQQTSVLPRDFRLPLWLLLSEVRVNSLVDLQ